MRIDDEQSAREAFGLDEERLPLAARTSTDWLPPVLIGLIVAAALACAVVGWSLGGR